MNVREKLVEILRKTTNGMKIGHYLEKMQTATLLLHTGHICHSRRKENDYETD